MLRLAITPIASPVEYGASWPGLRRLGVGIELANQTVAVFFRGGREMRNEGFD